MFKFLPICFVVSHAAIVPIDVSILYPRQRAGAQSMVTELVHGEPTHEMVSYALAIESIPVEVRIATMQSMQRGAPPTADAYSEQLSLFSYIDVRLFQFLARFGTRKLRPDEVNVHTACDIVEFFLRKFPNGDFNYLTPDYVIMWYRLVGVPGRWLWVFASDFKKITNSPKGDVSEKIILQIPVSSFAETVIQPRINRLLSTGYETEISGPPPFVAWITTTGSPLVIVKTRNFGDIFLQRFFADAVQADCTNAINRKELLETLSLRTSWQGKEHPLAIGDLFIHEGRLGPLQALIESIPAQRRVQILSSIIGTKTRKRLHDFVESLTDDMEKIYAHYTLSSLYIPESMLRLLLLIRQGQMVDAPALSPLSASSIVNYFIQQNPVYKFLTPEHVIEWYRIFSTSNNYRLHPSNSKSPGALPMYHFDMQNWRSSIIGLRMRRLQQTGSGTINENNFYSEKF